MKCFSKIIIVLLVITVFIFASCESDSDDPTLLDVATSTAGLESLVNVILFIDDNASEAPLILQAALSDKTEELTVFAPVNSAFDVFDTDGDGIWETSEISASGIGINDAEIANALLEIVAAHVVPEILDADAIIARAGVAIATLNEDISLTPSVVGTTITLTPSSGAAADVTDTNNVEASNGIAHVIDGVLALVLE